MKEMDSGEKKKKSSFQKHGWFYRHIYTIVAVAVILVLTVGIGSGIYFFIHQEDQNGENASLPAAANGSFKEFTDSIFKEWIQNTSIDLHYTLANPENYGIEQQEASWGSFTEEDVIGYYKGIETLRDQLQKFDSTELTREEQITYDVLDAYLQTEQKAKDLYLYEEPLSPLSGVQSQAPIFLSEYSFYRTEDVELYLKLCEKLPEHFKQILDFEKERSKGGLFMSDAVLDEIAAQCEQFISNVNGNMLISTFNDKIGQLSIEDGSKQEYIARNQQIVEGTIIPAYRELVDGLNAMRGTGINQGGLCNFKNGKEYYEYMAEVSTGSGLTIDEMKKKIMEGVYEDLSAVTKLMEKDPQISQQAASAIYPLSNPTDILAQLQEKMKENFPELPQVSCEVKAIHTSLQDSLSPAFYLSPPIDRTQDNVIYINQSPEYDLTKIYPTIAHEGYPGHLYQIVYFRQNNQSDLRKILNFSGFTEGWGTYAEYMSYGMMSTLEEPVQSYLQHISAATLGIHALMDIGIHYEGWDMERVRKYIQNYFGNVEEDTVREVYYNIVEEPANYLSYYVGYLEFLDLKGRAETEWNDQFTLKRFHQEILDIGPAPFPVIAKYLFQQE